MADSDWNHAAAVHQTESANRLLEIDLYNALNAAPVLSYNQTYNPATTTWLAPTSVLAARVIKIGASFRVLER